MFNTFRKFFNLAPYNRPAPTMADLKDARTVTLTVATPRYTIDPVGNRWAIFDGADVIRTYARRRDAVRGLTRLINA